MNVSVVIPVYNGNKTIGSCLNNLLLRGYDVGRLEVIVVDDGSTDRTQDLLSQYETVRTLRQSKNQGPAAARNRGAKEATGEIVLFTDADCVPCDGWLAAMLAPFQEDPRVVGVKGVYRTRQRELAARFVQIEYEDKYDKMRKASTIDFIDTYSAAYRRSVFLEIGGFDCRFPVACAEDVELSFRLAEQGYRMVFNPKAAVFHLHPSTWASYLRKKYKYAYWRAVALRRFPGKALRDSHTPVAQKLQLLLVPFSVLTLPWAFVSSSLAWASLAGWAAVLLSMAPFIAKSMQRDPAPALAAPLYLIPRALVQCAAVLMSLLESMEDRRKPAKHIDGSNEAGPVQEV